MLNTRGHVSQIIGDPYRPIREVKAIDVQDQRCRFLPAGMDLFFPEVEGLQVANSELVEIQSDDMQQFPHLKQLFMSENKLQSLENDVFENCPNIEYINLGQNNIMYMGTDIFKPLKNLQYANMEGNGCIDMKMESSNGIQTFASAISSQCPPTPQMLKREKDRKLSEKFRTTPTPSSTTSPDIDNLKAELAKLKDQLAQHDQKITEINMKQENDQEPYDPPPYQNKQQPSRSSEYPHFPDDMSPTQQPPLQPPYGPKHQQPQYQQPPLLPLQEYSGLPYPYRPQTSNPNTPPTFNYQPGPNSRQPPLEPSENEKPCSLEEDCTQQQPNLPFQPQKIPQYPDRNQPQFQIPNNEGCGNASCPSPNESRPKSPGSNATPENPNVSKHQPPRSNRNPQNQNEPQEDDQLKNPCGNYACTDDENTQNPHKILHKPQNKPSQLQKTCGADGCKSPEEKPCSSGCSERLIDSKPPPKHPLQFGQPKPPYPLLNKPSPAGLNTPPGFYPLSNGNYQSESRFSGKYLFIYLTSCHSYFHLDFRF